MKKVWMTLLLVLLWVATAVAAVNINTASQQELEALPGIGPAKAEAIVKYREEHGPFKRVDELTGVKGIGQKSMENMKDLLEVEMK